MQRAAGILVFAAVVAFATGARAQAEATPAEPSVVTSHHLVLSLERLLGVQYSHESTTAEGMSVRTGSSTAISLYAPRVAADLILGHGFSVGAALGLAYHTQTSTSSGESPITEGTTDIVVAPRVGYVFDLGRRVAIWPRAGVTFDFDVTTGIPNVTSGGTDSSSNASLLATVDVPVVLAVLPRVAITAGPTLDVTLWSHSSINGPDLGGVVVPQTKVLDLGLLAGVVALL